MRVEKKDYISLEDLLARNESYPANKKFFELLNKHKKGQRDDFVQEWNGWMEKDGNKNLLLDFGEFHFDINNEELKEVFSVLILGNCWYFDFLIFPNEVYFNGLKFSGAADFMGTEFSGETTFNGAEFSEKANFIGTKFSGEANFMNAEFNGEVDFGEAKFSNKAYFLIEKAVKEILLDAKFDNNVYFNMEFLSQANLDDTLIDITKIILSGKIDSSKVKKDQSNYRIFRRYYANKLDHELERKYFALELESKPFPKIKKLEKWSDVKNWLFYPFELIKDFGYRIITLLYKWTSDYGNSIFRPIIAVLIVYLFTILTAPDLGFDTGFVYEILGKYSRILLTHIPFGYSAGDSNIYKYSNDWMKFLNGIIMYVGLFLMGLAARNRFRIK
ncbi:MAG: hypothetical protein ACJAZX_001097 [Rickettsiales bacterium]|jgi:hypothetical protein